METIARLRLAPLSADDTRVEAFKARVKAEWEVYHLNYDLGGEEAEEATRSSGQ
jgi:hypothetical protein